jgi:hypothetical protein
MDVRDAPCRYGPLDGESRAAHTELRAEWIWLAHRADEDPADAILAECTRVPSADIRALWRCVGVYCLVIEGQVAYWQWHELAAGWPVPQTAGA